MATKLKKFDCIAFKEEMQSKLYEEYKGMSDEEITRRRLEKLATSDDPAAQLWRRLTAAKKNNRKAS